RPAPVRDVRPPGPAARRLPARRRAAGRRGQHRHRRPRGPGPLVTTAPAPGLTQAVELLERALAHTRVALADVGPDDLGAATPCVGWTLARLLAHMEDALDAFTEAASGQVTVTPVSPADDRVTALRDKACALLGAWTDARPAAVAVG